MNWSKIGNPVLSAVLRSPIHGAVDRSMLLITFTGRRSGRTFTTPVGYVREGDDVWIVPGWAERKRWWRNLTGEGASVTLRLCGREVPARGRAIRETEDAEAFARGRAAFVARFPKAASAIQGVIVHCRLR